MPQSKMNDAQKSKLQNRINAVKLENSIRIKDGRPNISLQGYSPDTCGCYIIEVMDKELPEAEQKIVDHLAFKCPDHDMLNDQECYSCIVGETPPGIDPNTVDSEQRRKNAFQALAMEDSEFSVEKTQPTGAIDPVTNLRVMRTSRIPNPDVEYHARFTGTAPHRRMEISFVGVEFSTQRVSRLSQIAEQLPGDNVVVDGASFFAAGIVDA